MRKNISIKRFVAFYIDGVIIAILSFCVSILISIIRGNPIGEIDTSGSSTLFFIQVVISIVYFLLTEFFMSSTLGKRMMKLEIIGLSNGYTLNRFIQIIKRTSMRFIPIDAFSILWNENGIMWHDWVSKTEVSKIYPKVK